MSLNPTNWEVLKTFLDSLSLSFLMSKTGIITYLPHNGNILRIKYVNLCNLLTAASDTEKKKKLLPLKQYFEVAEAMRS